MEVDAIFAGNLDWGVGWGSHIYRKSRWGDPISAGNRDGGDPISAVNLDGGIPYLQET